MPICEDMLRVRVCAQILVQGKKLGLLMLTCRVIGFVGVNGCEVLRKVYQGKR